MKKAEVFDNLPEQDRFLEAMADAADPGKDILIKRIESLHGVHTVEAAAELGFGTREYELINVD